MEIVPTLVCERGADVQEEHGRTIHCGCNPQPVRSSEFRIMRWGEVPTGVIDWFR